MGQLWIELKTECYIQELHSLKKFDQLIKLCREFHQDICKDRACWKCDFITKSNIFYLHNLITGKGRKNLQPFCRNCYRIFFIENVHLQIK